MTRTFNGDTFKNIDLFERTNCMMNIRNYLKPFVSNIELLHFKRSLYRQKILITRLIRYQGLFIHIYGPSKYFQQGIRYNNTLYVDRETFEHFGFSPLRNNPQMFIINEKRFNQKKNLNHCQICFRSTTKCRCKQMCKTIERGTQCTNDNIEQASTDESSNNDNHSQNLIFTELCINSAQLIAVGYPARKIRSINGASTIQHECEWNIQQMNKDFRLLTLKKMKFNQSIFLERFRQMKSNIDTQTIATAVKSVTFFR